jgi:hypothetical protein
MNTNKTATFTISTGLANLESESRKCKEAIAMNSKFPMLSKTEKDLVDKAVRSLKAYNGQKESVDLCVDILNYMGTLYKRYEGSLNDLLIGLSTYGDNLVDMNNGMINTCPASTVCHEISPLLLKVTNFHSATNYRQQRLFSNFANVWSYVTSDVDNETQLFKTYPATDGFSVSVADTGVTGLAGLVEQSGSFDSSFLFQADGNAYYDVSFVNNYSTDSIINSIQKQAGMMCGTVNRDPIISWLLRNFDNGPINVLSGSFFLIFYDPKPFCDVLADIDNIQIYIDHAVRSNFFESPRPPCLETGSYYATGGDAYASALNQAKYDIYNYIADENVAITEPLPTITLVQFITKFAMNVAELLHATRKNNFDTTGNLMGVLSIGDTTQVAIDSLTSYIERHTELDVDDAKACIMENEERRQELKKLPIGSTYSNRAVYRLMNSSNLGW